MTLGQYVASSLSFPLLVLGVTSTYRWVRIWPLSEPQHMLKECGRKSFTRPPSAPNAQWTTAVPKSNLSRPRRRWRQLRNMMALSRNIFSLSGAGHSPSTNAGRTAAQVAQNDHPAVSECYNPRSSFLPGKAPRVPARTRAPARWVRHGSIFEPSCRFPWIRGYWSLSWTPQSECSRFLAEHQVPFFGTLAAELSRFWL